MNFYNFYITYEGWTWLASYFWKKVTLPFTFFIYFTTVDSSFFCCITKYQDFQLTDMNAKTFGLLMFFFNCKHQIRHVKLADKAKLSYPGQDQVNLSMLSKYLKTRLRLGKLVTKYCFCQQNSSHSFVEIIFHLIIAYFCAKAICQTYLRF